MVYVPESLTKSVNNIDYPRLTMVSVFLILFLLLGNFVPAANSASSLHDENVRHFPLLLSVDGSPIGSLFEGMPVISIELDQESDGKVLHCYEGYYPEEDYGCYAPECPYVALCRFNYSFGCLPNYFPYEICKGCASDEWC